MALRSLDSIPTSKAFVVPAARTCGDHMGPDPELPGFEKNASKAMASRAKVAPSEFRCFKFISNDGALLSDEHGRTTFSMLPSAAQAIASSMGATAKRV